MFVVQVNVGRMCVPKLYMGNPAWLEPLLCHYCCNDTKKNLNTWDSLIRTDTKMVMVTKTIWPVLTLMINTVGSSLTSDERQAVTQYLNRYGYQANQNLSQAVRSESELMGMQKLPPITLHFFTECSSECQDWRRQES